MQESHNLFHAVHQLSRQLSKHINEVLAPYGLYSAQWAVLYVLNTNGPLTQTELCEYLLVEKPPMSRTIQKLVSLGLVIQVPGGDKRSKRIELTKKAISQYPIWEKAIFQKNQELLKKFPKSSQDDLFYLLTVWLQHLR